MARSTFKVLFYVNGSKERNGIVPIMGRVTINGTVAQFSCKQNIPKTLWDVKGNKAKGKSREARDINLALDNIKAQIIKHYQRISDREAFVTAEMVRNAYQGIGSEYETLLKAFDRENEVFKKRVGKDRVMATYRARVRARNHVAAFIKSFYRRSDMSMLELTPDFIKEFAAYLSTEAGLRNGSIWANCMWLKGVVMKAHYNGLIPRNPFIQFHISPNVKEREYLTEDELKAVMTHEFADSKLAYIRDIFIFASGGERREVDIVQTPQDKSRLPSEAAGYTLADSRTLPTDAERQSYIPRLELLVYLQTVETDDKGMWHNQVNIISLQSSWLRNISFEQGDAH